MGQGPLLVCERDPLLRRALELALERERPRSELIFSDDPARLPALLQRYPAVRLLVWNLDQVAGRLPNTLARLQRGRPPRDEPPLFSARRVLPIVHAVRRAHPSLALLLIAHEFPEHFQAAVLQGGGPIQFLTRPRDLRVTVEKIRDMLTDRPTAIRHWVVRLPAVAS